MYCLNIWASLYIYCSLTLRASEHWYVFLLKSIIKDKKKTATISIAPAVVVVSIT